MQNDIKYEVVKFTDNDFELEVNVSPFEDTVWLSLDQISQLFQRDRTVIGRHIKNIFSEEELSENSVCANFAHTANDGKTYSIKNYNLDVIISVGYRVKSPKAVLFRKWANKVLKQYLINGYVINPKRAAVTTENYLNLVNAVVRIDCTQIEIDKRLVNVEQKLSKTEFPTEKIFFDGQFFDAYSLIQQILEKATDEIIIIDNYADRSILDRLAVKKQGVKVILYTNAAFSKITELDINAFNKQYPSLTVNYTSKVHDRYVIIDNSILYHIGASLKDAGKKIFSITKLDSSFIVELLNRLSGVAK
jgi:predicted Zn-dependent protease with MMP-like domain